MAAQSAPFQRAYFPGDLAPITGIYRAVHTAHDRVHELIAISGEVFPACRTCRSNVSFELVRQANHMTHDMDFAGPAHSLP
jgi:hypothetical protein